jgi:hypothetical protein
LRKRKQDSVTREDRQGAKREDKELEDKGRLENAKGTGKVNNGAVSLETSHEFSSAD